MRKRLKPLGDLEQEVMNVVWAESCATVRCVCEKIQESRNIAYTTVMTTMDRLTKKRILKRTKVGKAYEYRPCYSCDELNERMSGEIIDSLIKNYGDLAIAQFVDIVDNIDPKKLAELKQQSKS